MWNCHRLSWYYIFSSIHTFPTQKQLACAFYLYSISCECRGKYVWQTLLCRRKFHEEDEKVIRSLKGKLPWVPLRRHLRLDILWLPQWPVCHYFCGVIAQPQEPMRGYEIPGPERQDWQILLQASRVIKTRHVTHRGTVCFAPRGSLTQHRGATSAAVSYLQQLVPTADTAVLLGA